MVKLSLCTTNLAVRHEDEWESGCIDPRILDLGTSWRWVVSFTPRPIYLRGKSPRYPLDRRLSGPQNRSGERGEEKILDTTGTRTPTTLSSSPVPSRYTDYATPVPVVDKYELNLYYIIFFLIFKYNYYAWVLVLTERGKGGHSVRKVVNHCVNIKWWHTDRMWRAADWRSCHGNAHLLWPYRPQGK
jgi:hypothetical protein